MIGNTQDKKSMMDNTRDFQSPQYLNADMFDLHILNHEFVRFWIWVTCPSSKSEG